MSSLTTRRRACGHRQRNREHRTAARPGSSLDVSVVFSQNGFGDAQAKAGPTAWTLGGIEGIEDIGQDLRRDTGPVVLKNDGHRLFLVLYANAQGAAIANLP